MPALVDPDVGILLGSVPTVAMFASNVPDGPTDAPNVERQPEVDVTQELPDDNGYALFTVIYASIIRADLLAASMVAV